MNRRSFLSSLALIPGLGWILITGCADRENLSDPPSVERFEVVSFDNGGWGPDWRVYRDRWSGECFVGNNGGDGGFVHVPKSVCDAKPLTER